MEFQLNTTHVPVPMGLEKETADLALQFRGKYDEFFAWVQGGETPLNELPQVQQEDLLTQLEVTTESLPDEQPGDQVENQERWYLERHDIEYFYGLARPAQIGCACPYGWVEKVNRIVDQQHAMFGVERFPRLEDKAAHMAWLLLKNQVFPDYNRGIGALAILVLLGRNEVQLQPKNEELLQFFSILDFVYKRVETEEKDEDQAIKILGEVIKGWRV